MSRLAYTLLEVIAASALTGTALVASLSLLRDAIGISERVDQQHLLHTLCVSKLEESLALTAAEFDPIDATGTFAGQGFESVRFHVIGSDSSLAGGVSDRLMALTCTVWHDANGDGTQSSGEPAVTLATKVAKMALYQAHAGS